MQGRQYLLAPSGDSAAACAASRCQEDQLHVRSQSDFVSLGNGERTERARGQTLQLIKQSRKRRRGMRKQRRGRSDTKSSVRRGEGLQGAAKNDNSCPISPNFYPLQAVRDSDRFLHAVHASYTLLAFLESASGVMTCDHACICVIPNPLMDADTQIPHSSPTDVCTFYEYL